MILRFVAHLLVFALLDLLVIQGSHGLTTQEISALNALLTSWPQLAHLPAQSWTSNVSSACLPPGFYGITCDNTSSHVTGLELSNITVMPIPEEIGGLEFLDRFSLVSCRGVSTGFWFLQRLHKLRSLILDRVRVFGVIPFDSLAKSFPLLEELTISFTSLEGNITQMESIPTLRSLNFSSCGEELFGSIEFVHGTLDVSFGRFPNLEVLDMSCTLVPPPPSVEGLPKLQVFAFQRTQGTSEVPDYLFTLPDIRWIDLSHTNFVAMLSRRDLGALDHLEHLDVSYSQLAGTFPHRLLSLPKMKYINFQSTQFDGELGVEASAPLEYFSIRYTFISGSIPRSMSNMTELRHLALGDSSLEGSIPPLGRMEKLEVLILDGLGKDTDFTQSGLERLHKLQIFSMVDSGSAIGFPNGFWYLEKLTDINVHGTSIAHHLTILPPELVSLDATDTDITFSMNLQVPSTLKTLIALRTPFESLDGVLSLSTPGSLIELHLSDNSLSGTFPTNITQPHLRKLLLSPNNIHGELPFNLLSLCPELQQVDLSRNALTGNIPNQPDNYRHHNSSLTHNTKLDLSNNRLSGSIPYTIGLIWDIVKLDNNELTSMPNSFIEWRSHTFTASLNQLEGTIPPFPFRMHHFDLHSNRITGTLPPLLSLNTLSVSNNRLHGNIKGWAQSSLLLHPARSIDISHNAFTGTIPPNFAAKITAEYIDFSYNQLVGELHPFQSMPPHGKLILSNNDFDTLSNGSFSANYIDLSSNRFSGRILQGSFSTTTYLNLANNSFQNSFLSSHFPLIESLDVSQNQLVIDMTKIRDFSSLRYLNASRNLQGKGNLWIGSLRNIQTLDLSHLREFRDINMTSVAVAFNRTLGYFNIESCPSLPKYQEIPPEIIVTHERLPLDSNSTTTECFKLSFNSPSPIPIFFGYDVDLFECTQCHCTQGHVGIPPSSCFQCPADATCDQEILSIPRNYFAYHINLDRYGTPIAVEECLPPAGISISNCQGLPYRLNKDFSIPDGQCKTGSAGRKCANCICDESGLGPCFFQRGPICTRCRTVLPLSKSISIMFTIVIFFILSLGIIMFLVLRSKHQTKTILWQQLPILKRLCYRAIYTIGVGYVHILVNFVQVLVELGGWSEWQLRAWADLVNANAEGLGLRCFFPILTNPTISLIAQLLLPFAVISVVLLSISFGNLVYWLTGRFKTPSKISEEESQEALLDSPNIQLTYRIDVRSSESYSEWALAASSTISLTQFFYFRTVLVASQYFFWNTQPLTNITFVQTQHWMLYESAHKLRMIAIPFVLLCAIGLPILFVLLAWRIRDTVQYSSTSAYYGSIFSRYRKRFYWWEIVLTIRKLAIAISLRALASGNAFRAGSVVIFISVVHIFQINLQPWKTKAENVAESISAFLLLATVIAHHLDNSQFQHSLALSGVVLTCSICYIIALVVLTIRQGVVGRTDYEAVSGDFQEAVDDDDSQNSRKSLLGFGDELEESIPMESAVEASEGEEEH